MGTTTQGTSHSDWHVRLRRILDTYFDQGELETLCFDLRFDFEELPGAGKSEKVVELIKTFSRMGRIEELIDYCSQLRPNIPWAELRAEAVKHPFAAEQPPGRHEKAAHTGSHPRPQGTARLPSASQRPPGDTVPTRHRRGRVGVLAVVLVALVAVFGWCGLTDATCPWEGGDPPVDDRSPTSRPREPETTTAPRTAMADLEVTFVRVYPGTPSLGQAFTVRAQVGNVGDATSDRYDIAGTVRNISTGAIYNVGAKTMDPMHPREDYTVLQNEVSVEEAGSYQFWLEITPRGDDADDSNNAAGWAFTVSE